MRSFIDLAPAVGYARGVKGRDAEMQLYMGWCNAGVKFNLRLCREWITKAIQELRMSPCPNKLGAIIWYEAVL